MKKAFLFATLAWGALCLSVHATTVGYSAGPSSRTVVDSTSANVAAGSLVWIGAFNNPTGFTFNAAVSIATNVANIEAAGGWEQFGLNPSTQVTEATTNTLTISSVLGVPKIGGAVEDDVTGSPTSSADFFNGKTIYLWVFNGTSVANSTQMGIFQATGASPAWTFPTNGGGVGDSVTLATTSSSAPTISALGGAGSASSTQLVLSAAVPEPSTWVALVGAASFVAMLRRRRPSQS